MSSKGKDPPGELICSALMPDVRLDMEKCKVFYIEGRNYFVEIFRLMDFPKLFKVDVECGVEKTFLVVHTSSGGRHIGYASRPIPPELESKILEIIQPI